MNLTPRFAAAVDGKKLDGSNSVRKIDWLHLLLTTRYLLKWKKVQ